MPAGRWRSPGTGAAGLLVLALERPAVARRGERVRLLAMSDPFWRLQTVALPCPRSRQYDPIPRRKARIFTVHLPTGRPSCPDDPGADRDRMARRPRTAD